MKPKIITIVTILVSIALLLSANVFAQPKIPTTGVGIRGSFYKLDNGPAEVTVVNHGEYSNASVGGGGGWLFLYSRINPTLCLEFSIGAIGHVEEETSDYFQTETDVNAITPLLVGLRQDLFSPTNQSALRPYVSVGAGPYWITDVVVKENMYDEEVHVKTKQFRGGYLGIGLDFRITNWMALNFDAKQHFVDFNRKHDMSGVDYGFGFTIMWGNYSL